MIFSLLVILETQDQVPKEKDMLNFHMAPTSQVKWLDIQWQIHWQFFGNYLMSVLWIKKKIYNLILQKKRKKKTDDSQTFKQLNFCKKK